MVKAGVYLVARLHPVLGGTALWDHSLVIVGGATMLAAAFLATRQTQFKRILAYSTVSSLGTMMMLIGLGAAKAAAAYLLAHGHGSRDACSWWPGRLRMKRGRKSRTGWPDCEHRCR